MQSLSAETKIKVKKVKKSKINGRDKNLLIMCIPAITFLFIFCYIPMLGLVLAFKDYRFNKGILGSEWIGFKNFEFFLKSDSAWRITRNTIGFNLIFILVGTIAAVGVALILNEIRSKNARKVYQTAMFLPYFLSWVVVGYMLYAFLNQNYGIFNRVIGFFGYDPVSWYTNVKAWTFLIPAIFIWKNVGYNSVIYYAGLLSIDSSYYEAAELDGATRWQCIKYITLPHLRPLIIIMTILSLGKIFNSDFGLFYQGTMDSSALYEVTDVLDTYVYRALKVSGDVGMSAAVCLYQSVIGCILVVTANKIIKRIDADNAIF